MAKPVITKLNLAKKNVQTQEKVKISVFAFPAIDEPVARRMEFTLGNNQKQIK